MIPRRDKLAVRLSALHDEHERLRADRVQLERDFDALMFDRRAWITRARASAADSRRRLAERARH